MWIHAPTTGRGMTPYAVVLPVTRGAGLHPGAGGLSVRENPGRLAGVKRRVHLRTRRDTGALVAVEAESLRVMTGLAVRGVREDVRGMPLDEVGVVKAPGLLRGMAAGADLFGVALCAVHGGAGSDGSVPSGKIGSVDG